MHNVTVELIKQAIKDKTEYLELIEGALDREEIVTLCDLEELTLEIEATRTIVNELTEDLNRR